MLYSAYNAHSSLVAPETRSSACTDPDSRNVVATSVVLGAGRRSVCARSHSISVVLADEKHRKGPQLRHVVRLVHLALVGRTVPVQGHAEVVCFLVLHCEGHSSAERHLVTKTANAEVKTRSNFWVYLAKRLTLWLSAQLVVMAPLAQRCIVMWRVHVRASSGYGYSVRTSLTIAQCYRLMV